MVVATPLLETKLYVPRRRRGLVARPRLRQRLDRGVESKLTLVSAPAGFGKTRGQMPNHKQAGHAGHGGVSFRPSGVSLFAG